MKTPKVATPKPKLKFNTPKGGIVRKSLGSNSAASLKKLTSKSKEQVLSLVKDNEENFEFKNKTPKKSRMSLPANALRNSKESPNNTSGKSPKKSPKAKKAASPQSPKAGKQNNLNNKTPAKDSPTSKLQNTKKTPQNKNIPQNVKTPASAENNSSPIKQNVESKRNKVPFNLDDSLANKTPNGLKQKKGSKAEKSPKSKLNSPEVELGLQLEEALSPKSKKEKKKKMSISVKVAAQGKVGVNKKVVKKLDTTSDNSASDSVPKKRKRSRRRKAKKIVESNPPFLKLVNATNAVNALLKACKPQKSDLLSEDDYIFMQFSLYKQSKDARGVYKVVLPHCILPDTPEVCLIVPDLKGKKNEPEEAIEHYKELMKQKDITSITEIIPIRKLKQEYSQHEEKRKLANRFDCIITDGRISHAAQLGKRFARAKKCICPIKFTTNTLKEDMDKALRKVAIFSSGRGTSFSVKCGRRGMSAGDIAENIVAIGDFLASNKNLIGEPLNVSLVAIKTATSSAFPVYVSTGTPNDVQKPKGKPKKTEEPVEDEVTTVPNATVVVHPSGTVKVKKRKNEEDDDVDVKPKGNKKAKTNVSKKIKAEADSSDDDEMDEDSDDIYLSNEDDSEVDSLNGTDDEAESDDDDQSEEDDDDDQELEDSDDDNDESADEEEIEAAEKIYLEELRKLQDEIAKKKGKKSGKTANLVEKKENQSKQQNKNAAAKSGKKKEKKELGSEQKQGKKAVLKEQDNNTKGKKFEKQNHVKVSQNNLPKKNKGGSPQNQQKGNQNQIQKKNKFGSPQNQQKGKVQQFGKGKEPNKRNAGNFQKGSPKQGKKQFKKSPGGKNKN